MIPPLRKWHDNCRPGPAPTTYGALHRPIGFASVPRGFTEIGAHPDFRHGTVTYPQALKPDEAAHLGLREIPTPARHAEITEAVTDGFRKYASKHLDMADRDPHYFKRKVGQHLDPHNAHMGYDEVAGLVETRLRAEAGRPKAAVEATKAGPIANAPGLQFDWGAHRWKRTTAADEPGIHLHPDTKRAHVVEWHDEDEDFRRDVNEPQHEMAAKMNATLDAYAAGHLEFKQPGASHHHALIVPDASEKGRWRYSEYDPAGFASHSTFDSAHEAAAAAGAYGYTEPAPGSLDRLSQTEEWERGTRGAKINQLAASLPRDAAHAVYSHYGHGGWSEEAYNRIMKPEHLAALRRGEVAGQ